ncbi:WD40-repeat-containing domain protein [Syncephalis plumigaleata]|nr:WD40-repeat-containing domain protein [Syncephalis plumigaleata]
MKFFTGDELGLLRSITVRLNVPATPANESDHEEADQESTKRARKPALEMEQWGNPDRSCSVQQLSWATNLQTDWCSSSSSSSSSTSKLILLARKNGKIEYRSSDNGTIVKEYQEENTAKDLEDQIVGCWSDYKVECTRSVSVMRVHPTQNNLLATGGKDNNLTIWDINRVDDSGKPQHQYQAKNLPNDFLDLKRPVHITDMAFTDDTNPASVALITANNEVQVYDFRQKRRPVINSSIGKRALTTMTLSPSNKEMYCADNYSNVHCVDLSTGKLRCSFKGFSGAVTSLECTDKHLITVSLDRHARVHELGNPKPLKSIYLKQRLSHVLLDDSVKEEEEDQDRNEDDEIWAAMETTKRSAKRIKKQNK